MEDEEWQNEVGQILGRCEKSTPNDDGHPWVTVDQADDAGRKLNEQNIEVAGICRTGVGRIIIWRRARVAQANPGDEGNGIGTPAMVDEDNKNVLETIEKILSSDRPSLAPLSPDIKPGSGINIPLNCIFSGPPGTGKTFAAQELLKEIKTANQYAEVCFHPATAYEDFVRALQSDGKCGFEGDNKAFGNICDDALKAPKKLFAILIDEINRANLPAVLGELMTALEYRGNAVTVPHAVKSPEVTPGVPLRGNNKLIVPPNLLVIGTMNTADRSTGLLDYALRRRFIFFPFKPSLSAVGIANPDKNATDTYSEVLGLFYGRSDILAAEFEPDDVAVGHSFFLETTTWKFKAKYQVAPLLEEYIRDGIFKEPADSVRKLIIKLRGL